MVINGRKMVAPAFLDSLGGVTAKQQIIGDALGTVRSTHSIRPARLTDLFWSLEVQPAVSSRVKRGIYSASAPVHNRPPGVDGVDAYGIGIGGLPVRVSRTPPLYAHPRAHPDRAMRNRIEKRSNEMG